MPRREIIKNSFVGGEISPLVLGRTDQAKYANACEMLHNWWVFIQGGINTRWGTRYIVDALGPSRLLPFIVSPSLAYQIEFGNQTLRFFVNDGLIYTNPGGTNPPPWSLTLGANLIDGSVTWQQCGHATWQASHSYPSNTTPQAFIIDSNGNIQWNTSFASPGISGSGSHPTWNTIPFGTTPDGTCAWVNLGQASWHWLTNYPLFITSAVIDSNGNIEVALVGGTSGQYGSGSPVPYVISSPYNTSLDDLWDIHITQVASTMYITHPNHPPMKLIRISDANWILSQPAFFAPPNTKQDQDVGTQKNAGLAISGTTITSTNNVFIAGDVGKYIIAGAGIGLIISLSAPTSTDGTTGATLFGTAIVQIIDAYDLSTYAVGAWFLRNGPLGFFSPGTWASGTQFWTGSKVFGFGKSITVMATTSHPTDKSWEVGTSTPPANETYNGGFTDCFRTIDVGLYVPFAGGYGQITAVTNSTTVQVTILSIPTVVEETFFGNPIIAPTPPGGWYLESPAFTTGNYPMGVCFEQDRLWFAGTLGANPNTFWGSVTGDYENFALGTLDDAGIRFDINSGDFEHVHWLAAFQGNLIAGTVRSEYVINGGTGTVVSSAGAPITPSAINTIKQSRYGCDRIQAIMVDDDLVFIQRSKQKAYQFAYNAISSSYGSKNLTLLNELITVAGFKEMIYWEDPYKIIWFTDTANNLVGLTYSKEQDVWAWHRHFTGQDTGDGFVSVSVIPTGADGETDETWFVCKRIRNGATVYTIEVLDSDMELDCGGITTFSSPVTQISGLAYLQGRPVTVVADGRILPTVIMDGTGVYNLPPGVTGTVVQAGIPFAAEALTVRPEPAVSVQGLVKRWLKIWARVYQTLWLTLNGTNIPFREFSTPLDEAQPVFTGDVQIINLGYDRDGRINIKQSQPQNSTVLAIFGAIEVSDGI